MFSINAFSNINTYLYFVNLFSVLQILEQLSLKGNINNYEDFTKSVLQEIKKEGLSHMYKLVCNIIVKDKKYQSFFLILTYETNLLFGVPH